MPIQQRDRDGVTIVTISGDVNYELTLELAGVLDEIVGAGAARVLIVPRGIELLNSMAIGVLFTRRNRVLDKGGEMALAEVRPRLAKVLSITRFDRLVKFYPDVESGVSALLGATPGE